MQLAKLKFQIGGIARHLRQKRFGAPRLSLQKYVFLRDQGENQRFLDPVLPDYELIELAANTLEGFVKVRQRGSHEGFFEGRVRLIRFRTGAPLIQCVSHSAAASP